MTNVERFRRHIRETMIHLLRDLDGWYLEEVPEEAQARKGSQLLEGDPVWEGIMARRVRAKHRSMLSTDGTTKGCVLRFGHCLGERISSNRVGVRF
ncbi:hypothetical protein AtNW77_Chr3g0197141 [Arabidopsis thaliana]